MATLREILQQKEDRLQSIPDTLASQTQKVQKQVLAELISLLDELDKKDGNIIPSTKNIARINEIAEKLSSFIFDDTDYSAGLTQFAKEFNVQAGLTQDYFVQLQDSFDDKKLYRDSLALSQRQTIELLTKAGINQGFINPMKDILQASIISGSAFSNAINVLTDFVLGTENKEGAMLSHVKQVAYDGFAFSDRQYVKLVSKDLEYEFFQYFGGLIRDSRCFCAQRANGYFHEKEVEYWGETPSLWDKRAGCKHGGGRVPETNASTIWTYLGGYNCRHQIVPVLLLSVPKKAVNRAVKSGYYKPVGNYIALWT